MIKYIFFDLDDTILDFHKAEHTALAKTLTHFNVSPDKEVLDRYSVINASQWKLLEKKQLTLPEVKVRRYKLLFDELSLNIDPKEATAYYEDMLSIGHWFIDGAEELLKTLYLRYELYLASNGTPRVQHSRINSADIEKYFKGMFISDEIGVSKPNKGFFDHCFSTIKSFDKDNAIIVGDSISSDILGGKNAGIRTVWFNPKHNSNSTDVTPDFEIDKLELLYDILENN